MAANSRERKQLVLTYDAQHPNSELSDLAEKFKRTSTDRFQSYKKEEEFIEEVDSAAQKTTDSELAEKLRLYNSKQKDLMSSLKSKANEYNRFISKAPAKAVAAIFGFKPF